MRGGRGGSGRVRAGGPAGHGAQAATASQPPAARARARRRARARPRRLHAALAHFLQHLCHKQRATYDSAALVRRGCRLSAGGVAEYCEPRSRTGERPIPRGGSPRPLRGLCTHFAAFFMLESWRGKMQ